MSNYSKWNAKQDPRTELHDVLGLTGAEISINNLPAGVGVPFVHSHKKNEEIYIILSGKGTAANFTSDSEDYGVVLNDKKEAMLKKRLC